MGPPSIGFKRVALEIMFNVKRVHLRTFTPYRLSTLMVQGFLKNF